mmetsp:Transcript_48439/g.135980  ORF Transcript_48439/g.135980 Transcript_48439/m.135980 type:complete len:342 (-) Transcript_48439:971-1996(-)
MWNPPDHYIEAVSEKASVALLLEAMRSDPVTNAIGSVGVSGGGGVGSVNGLGADTLAPSLASPSVSKTMAPLSYQVGILIRRGFKNSSDVLSKKLEWFLVLALGLVWGGLWFGVATPSNRGKHAADAVSVIFFIAAQWSWGPAFDVLGAFPQERDVLAKERASEVYSIESYYISKCLCELPVQMVMPAVFLLLLWPMVGLPFSILPAIYGITIINAWVSASISTMLMCLIFDGDLVMKVLIVVFVYCMSAGGFFINMAEQPAYIGWARYTSYWYYSLGLYTSVAITPFDDDDQHRMSGALDSYSFSDWSDATNLLILVTYGVVCRVLAYVFLKFSSKIKFS